MTKQEEWRTIPGHEKYQVSNCGQIKSFHYKGIGRFLKVRLYGAHTKYYHVALTTNKKMKTFSVHSLVALIFIGDRPEGLVIDHIDNNPLNNHVDNLQYITNKRNCIKDKVGGQIYEGKDGFITKAQWNRNQVWIARIKKIQDNMY